MSQIVHKLQTNLSKVSSLVQWQFKFTLIQTLKVTGPINYISLWNWSFMINNIEKASELEDSSRIVATNFYFEIDHTNTAITYLQDLLLKWNKLWITRPPMRLMVDAKQTLFPYLHIMRLYQGGHTCYYIHMPLWKTQMSLLNYQMT